MTKLESLRLAIRTILVGSLLVQTLAFAEEAPPEHQAPNPVDRGTATPMQEEYSDTNLHLFDISLEVGAPISRTSNFTNVGSVAPALGLTFYSHWDHHGVFLNFSYEGFGSTTPSLFGSSNATGSVNQGFFTVGYSFRAYFFRHFEVTYDIGPGIYVFDFFSGSSSQCGAAALINRVGLNYRWGHSMGKFGVGVLLYDALVANQTLGVSGGSQSAALGGNSLGLEGRVIFGF